MCCWDEINNIFPNDGIVNTVVEIRSLRTLTQRAVGQCMIGIAGPHLSDCACLAVGLFSDALAIYEGHEW